VLRVFTKFFKYVSHTILPLVLPRISHPPPRTEPPSLQFQARKDLLIRESGSLAVLAEVSFFFMPFMRAQKESRREPPSGCGRLSPGLPGLAAL